MREGASEQSGDRAPAVSRGAGRGGAVRLSGVLGGGGCAALGPGAEVAECGVGEEVSCKRGFEIYMQGKY